MNLPIRARTIGSLSVAVAMALGACTNSSTGNGTPQADSPPSVSPSADTGEVDGEQAGDSPDGSTVGMTVDDAVAAGLPLTAATEQADIYASRDYPEEGGGVSINVDISDLTDRELGLLIDLDADGDIDEIDVTQLLTKIEECEQKVDSRYTLTVDPEYGYMGSQDCVYEGDIEIGDTGKHKIQQITADDLIVTQDGTTATLDNVWCFFSNAPSCYDKDFTVSVPESGGLTLTMPGWDRSANNPTPPIIMIPFEETHSESVHLMCSAASNTWGDETICAFADRDQGVSGIARPAGGNTTPYEVSNDGDTATIHLPDVQVGVSPQEDRPDLLEVDLKITLDNGEVITGEALSIQHMTSGGLLLQSGDFLWATALDRIINGDSQ